MKYEDSKKDREVDRRLARQRKMSEQDFETSPYDADDESRDEGQQGGSDAGNQTARGMGAARRGGRYHIA